LDIVGNPHLHWNSYASHIYSFVHLNKATRRIQHKNKVRQKEQKTKLEAKDVLPNTNCTQASEKAEKCRFLLLVTLTFKLVQVRDQTRLPCEFGANPFSAGMQSPRSVRIFKGWSWSPNFLKSRSRSPA